jgi:tRNA threonylcarbamoyladenosine modification (KEOPS) complex Cgi121 subunit
VHSKKFDSCFCVLLEGNCNTISFTQTLKSVLLDGPTVFFQAVSVTPIVSFEQVFFAVKHARTAFREGFSFSKSVSLEFLLRLTGKKQVSDALSFAGAGSGKNVLLVCFGENKKEVMRHLIFAKKALKFEEKKGLVEKNFSENKKFLMQFHGINEHSLSHYPDKDAALRNFIIEKNAVLGFF